MIVVDVNLLLAAHRAEHPHHERAAHWLGEALGTDQVVIPDLCWVGLTRIATNPRVFTDPSTIDDVDEFASAIVAAPGYRSVPGLAPGVGAMLDECRSADARGNLVPDAYIAAVARSLACPVATFDRDFRRFDDLRLVEP